MAENLTIARPYAQAVFATAVEHNSIDKWLNMLNAMSCACSDESFRASLKNASSPDVASDNLIKLLDGLLDEYGQNFVKILGENFRFEVVPEIFEEFTRLKNEHDNVVVAHVTSARKLTKTDEKALIAKLSAKYNSAVKLTTSVDRSLIGGAILKIGDEVIDASVKTSLDSLSSTLK